MEQLLVDMASDMIGDAEGRTSRSPLPPERGTERGGGWTPPQAPNAPKRGAEADLVPAAGSAPRRAEEKAARTARWAGGVSFAGGEESSRGGGAPPPIDSGWSRVGGAVVNTMRRLSFLSTPGGTRGRLSHREGAAYTPGSRFFGGATTPYSRMASHTPYAFDGAAPPALGRSSSMPFASPGFRAGGGPAQPVPPATVAFGVVVTTADPPRATGFNAATTLQPADGTSMVVRVSAPVGLTGNELYDRVEQRLRDAGALPRPVPLLVQEEALPEADVAVVSAMQPLRVEVPVTPEDVTGVTALRAADGARVVAAEDVRAGETLTAEIGRRSESQIGRRSDHMESQMGRRSDHMESQLGRRSDLGESQMGRRSDLGESQMGRRSAREEEEAPSAGAAGPAAALTFMSPPKFF